MTMATSRAGTSRLATSRGTAPGMSWLGRILAGPVLLGVVALAGTGCAKTDRPEPGPPAPTAAVLTGSPASPSASQSPAGPPPPTNLADYPQTARVYADWVLAAWRQHQIDWLGELTTAEVQSQIIEIPGPPDMNWTFVRCEGAAGSAYCRFANANGDAITMRVSTSLLAMAHAVVGVTFDATTFPSGGLEYAKAFIAAWQDGNVARMKALAVPDVVAYAATVTAPVSPAYTPVSGGGGLMQVTVTATGFHVVLDVGTTLLGTPHAIVGSSP
jgi:hypothetical protein